MPKIILLGDVHGKWEVANKFINYAIQEFDVAFAIQLGDFGFYKEICAIYKSFRFPIPLYVIDGNHEDHSLITDENINYWAKNNNIHFIKRGTVWNLFGCKMGFVGGALNVDRRQYGTPGTSTCNYVTLEEAKEYANVFNAFGKLDFIFAHTCPHSIGVKMVGDSSFTRSIYWNIKQPLGLDTGELTDCGEPALTELWKNLTEKPSHFVFGHFHNYHEKQVRETRFNCIGTVDYTSGLPVIPFIIDTKTKTLEAFPEKQINQQELITFKRKKKKKNDRPN